MAFFAVWPIVLVVCSQALEGRLPTEISGRGVRYAEAEKTQGTVGDIADELGLDIDEATAVTLKVIHGRGTPSMVARRAALDRLSRMRVA